MNNETIVVNKADYQELVEAAEHCYRVFASMAYRGAYPQELLPTNEYMNPNANYLGKQGFIFLAKALQKFYKIEYWSDFHKYMEKKYGNFER